MKQTFDIAFTADWLALREPADHAARDQRLLRQAATCVAPGAFVLDLGSGTGSTARAFASVGSGDLSWVFFDNDAPLLAIAQAQHPRSQAVVGDLADVDELPLDGVGLVTASALLDLMPLGWVEKLARRLHEAGLPFYAALNYNGVMRWFPPVDGDESMTATFNAHQRRDKGMGAALGPVSSETTARVFADLGYEVTVAESPWKIAGDQAALHAELISGIAGAVVELDPGLSPNWLDARGATIPTADAYIGHTDLLAVPGPSNPVAS